MKRGKAAAAGILAAVLFFVHMAVSVKAEEKGPGNLYALDVYKRQGRDNRIRGRTKEGFQYSSCPQSQVWKSIFFLGSRSDPVRTLSWGCDAFRRKYRRCV